MSKEIKSVIKNVPPQKTSHPGPDGFTGEFHTTVKELLPILLRLLQKLEEVKTLENSLCS